MEKLELVLKVLERGANGIEALGLPYRRVIVVLDSEVLDKDEAGPVLINNGVVCVGVALLIGGVPQGLDGVEELSSGNRVNGVAELIV